MNPSSNVIKLVETEQSLRTDQSEACSLRRVSMISLITLDIVRKGTIIKMRLKDGRLIMSAINTPCVLKYLTYLRGAADTTARVTQITDRTKHSE